MKIIFDRWAVYCTVTVFAFLGNFLQKTTCSRAETRTVS